MPAKQVYSYVIKRSAFLYIGVDGVLEPVIAGAQLETTWIIALAKRYINA